MYRWILSSLAGVSLLLAGCPNLCDADGTDGLSGFDMDCDDVAFHIDETATRLQIVDSGGGEVALEMTAVHTLSQGVRFETGGEYDLEGNYYDPDAAIAAVEEGWIQITAWEAVEGESYGQRVDFEFHIEVEATSRFVGGELDGEALGVSVFTSQ